MLLQISTSALVHAGSIGFSISFTGDEIAIANTGSDAAYQLSGWTLDSSSHWRQMQLRQGNPAYLPVGQSVQGRRLTPAPVGGLGRADPLLLVLHDQAGSRMAQLAWHVAPAAQQQPVPTQRRGGQLSMAAADATAQAIIASYGIVLPYDGIQHLAAPWAAGEAPPNPARHPWAGGAPMLLETGAGQGGVWLVHETASGDLRMQIVPDGVARGQEQMPVWLVWGRSHLLALAGVLATLGALLLAAGWVGLARRRRRH